MRESLNRANDESRRQAEAKQALRRESGRLRRQLQDKDERSQALVSRLLDLPCYRAAQVVLWYVDIRSEVRTRQTIREELEKTKPADPKSIVVPYCVEDRLKLFRLERFDELVPGQFGILEPQQELRQPSERQVSLTELDLIVTPGVAFDHHGARLGQGRGFYDRLLGDAPKRAVRVGLAFECQIADRIPTEAHDMRMDLVITEAAVYNVRTD